MSIAITTFSDLSKLVKKEATPTLRTVEGEVSHGGIRLRPSKEGLNVKFVSVLVYTNTGKHCFNFCKSFTDLLEIAQAGVLSTDSARDLKEALVKYANMYAAKGIV